MVRVFVFLAAAQLVLVVLALISCLSAERVRGLPRSLWLPVILLLPVVGATAYLLVGRPGSGAAGRLASATTARPPASPDDDPDFLQTLNADTSRRERELFERWEQDLTRPVGPPGKPTSPGGKDDKLDGPGDADTRQGGPDGRRPRDNEDTPPTEV
jgi:hypothetical protein